MIHLLPVTSRPFFPGQAVPLLMELEHWAPTVKAVEATGHGILGIVLADAKTPETAKPADFHQIGTACRVHRVQPVEGRLQVLVECLQRFRIDQVLEPNAPFSARVHYFPESLESAKDCGSSN